MAYVVYDTASNDYSTVDQLDEAIRFVDDELSKQEHDGRVIDREREGRWAIYDGYMVRMIWIEAENGSVISFARQQRRNAGQLTKSEFHADSRADGRTDSRADSRYGENQLSAVSA